MSSPRCVRLTARDQRLLPHLRMAYRPHCTLHLADLQLLPMLTMMLLAKHTCQSSSLASTLPPDHLSCTTPRPYRPVLQEPPLHNSQGCKSATSRTLSAQGVKPSRHKAHRGSVSCAPRLSSMT